MSAEVSFEIVHPQSILMKTLPQESEIEDIVFAKKRIPIEFSLFLRKLTRIRDLGLLE
jgi:hypothetical protein